MVRKSAARCDAACFGRTFVARSISISVARIALLGWFEWGICLNRMAYLTDQCREKHSVLYDNLTLTCS